jgi:ABC-type multidrug transport system fused ATPase/permease subunit
MSVMPQDEQPNKGMISRLNRFLDKFVLPYPVKFLTNRITILVTMLLLIPLIAFADNSVFVLATNSYLNVMSVVVSSTVLLYSTIAAVRDQRAAERREAIAQKQQAMIEERAEETYQHILQIHDHLDAMRAEMTQHVSKSLDEVQRLLMLELHEMQAASLQRSEETHQAMMENHSAQRQQFDDLNQRLEQLQQRMDTKGQKAES